MIARKAKLSKKRIVLEKNQKVPAQRALSSPSGEAAEDNVVERENFWGGRNYGITDNGKRKDRQTWNLK